MQFNYKILEIIAGYKELIQRRFYERRNVWDGFIPGDLFRCGRIRLVYLGIDRNGISGMHGTPEPFFGLVDPPNANTICYLRSIDPSSQADIFGRPSQLAQTENTGIYVGYLNATKADLDRVGHIIPRQWDRVVEQVKKELSCKDASS